MKPLISFLFLVTLPLGLAYGKKGSTQGVHAHFEQIVKSSLSGKKITSTGTLKYMYPGKIRFENKDKILVSNGKKTWMHTRPFFPGEKGETQVVNESSSFYGKLFDALKDWPAKKSKLFSSKAVVEGTLLSFSKEAQGELGLKSAILAFKNKKNSDFFSLKSMRLTKTDGKTLSLHFKELKRASFTESEFTFK